MNFIDFFKLKKIREKNNKGLMILLNVGLIMLVTLAFIAYLVIKSVAPDKIVGGQNPQIKNNYKASVEDSTLVDGTLYRKVFGDEANCHQHFPLGVAVSSKANPEKTALFCYGKYAVQYNTETKTPIWAAHVIKGEDFKKGEYVERTNDFREDKNIAGLKVSSKPQDYTRTGFDRGHLAPAADFSYNPKFMSESFYMTNIAPQAPNHNRQIWANLEKSVRQLSKHKAVKELYITTGVVYYHNKGLKFGDQNGTLGSFNGIQIPTYFYKVIVEPKSGHSAAYLIPNTNAVANQHHNNFLIKISELEKVAKVDFHSKLSKELKLKIENNSGGLARSLQ